MCVWLYFNGILCKETALFSTLLSYFGAIAMHLCDAWCCIDLISLRSYDVLAMPDVYSLIVETNY